MVQSLNQKRGTDKKNWQKGKFKERPLAGIHFWPLILVQNRNETHFFFCIWPYFQVLNMISRNDEAPLSGVVLLFPLQLLSQVSVTTFLCLPSSLTSSLQLLLHLHALFHLSSGPASLPFLLSIYWSRPFQKPRCLVPTLVVVGWRGGAVMCGGGEAKLYTGIMLK